MLEDYEIENNKQKFINLIRTNITRDGADVEGLIRKLENSDFFTAPASTQYHCSYEGGLCNHCLHVYNKLNNLIKMEYPDYTIDASGEICKIDGYQAPYSVETIIIVSLLHDMSKMNFYEVSERNVKDEKGNWVKVPFIKVREANDRFIYSCHGVNSAFMVESFIPLTPQESAAIINHMGWSDDNFSANTISDVFNRYTLAMLLHTADLLATYTDERI